MSGNQGLGGLGRSTAVMASGTAVSRVLGVVRAALLVAAIGLNVGAANAFALANWLPSMLYMLIAGGVLNAVLVPQVVKAYRSDAGQEFVDRLLTVSAVILLGLSVVLTASAPLIVRVAGGSTDPATTALTVTFAVWCLPQVFFYGLYSLLGQVLNARGSFGPYMWAPVVNNVVAIAGLAAFIAVYGRFTAEGSGDVANWDAARIALLAAPATLGVATQAVVLVAPLRRAGVRLRPRTGWRGTGLGSAGRVAGWTFAALLVGQAGVLAVQRVANSAGAVADAAGQVAGSVAGNNAYSQAFTIFMLPHSLVTVSLLTALFTGLSVRATAGDTAAVRATFARGLRLIGVFALPATAALIVLALPVVRLVLPTSTPAEAGSMAPLIVALALGLTALGAWSLCQRVFYAYEDARGLFRIQVAMAVVVAGAAGGGWWFAPVRWWTAIACAGITASYALGAVWAGIEVRRRLGGSGRGVLGMLGRAALAALGAGVAGWTVLRPFGDLSRMSMGAALAACVLAGTIMVVGYVVLLRLLGVEELAQVARPLLMRIRPALSRLGRTMTVRDDRSDTGEHGGDLLDEVVIGHGTVLAGRFRLHSPEPGDLAGVEPWRGHDEVLDRPVRVMVLRTERSLEAKDAARRAALVIDPRLIRVLDVGVSDGVPYVVTEPAVGRTLAELVERQPLPADQVRALVGEVAAALEVARRRGVHHLALRPSTVRITPDGGVQLTGLGVDGAIAHRGPTDARSTSRADAVALVALLYLGLTGRWPVQGDLPTGGSPTAPMVSGAPVPPAELSPAVPNDLDTLCAVTFGPHDDGPHTPGELVRDLEPWGAVVPPDHVWQGLWPPAGAVAAPAVDAGPGEVENDAGAEPGEAGGDPGDASDVVDDPDEDPDEEPDEDSDEDPNREPVAVEPSGVPDATAEYVLDLDEGAGPASAAPVALPVARLSVSQTLVKVGDAPPGTPPPARPDRAVAGPREADPAEPDVEPADPEPAVESAAPKPPAAFAAPGVPLTAGRRRWRPDSGLIILLLVLVGVGFGIHLAVQALSRPLTPIGGVGGMPEWTPEDTLEPSASTPTSPEPTEDPEPEPVAPVIVSAQQIDPPPDGDENEHPELVDLAIDGDPATVWYSRTYVNPEYGMKSGIGFAVALAEPATVTSVTLDVRGSGGNVEIRLTDPATPTEGEVLASGPVGPGSTFSLSTPTEGSHVVAWFTALPQTADGSNRIELATFDVG